MRQEQTPVDFQSRFQEKPNSGKFCHQLIYCQEVSQCEANLTLNVFFFCGSAKSLETEKLGKRISSGLRMSRGMKMLSAEMTFDKPGCESNAVNHISF